MVLSLAPGQRCGGFSLLDLVAVPARKTDTASNTATGTATDTATDTATTDGPTQRDRESWRETGGVRRAAAGRPTPTPGIKLATQMATVRRTRTSGGGLCVIARGTKEQKPPFFSSAIVPWGLFKSIWCFFVCDSW